MSNLEKFFAAARQREARVVLPEMEDPRVAEAAQRMEAEGLCTPLPLGDITDAQVEALVAARGMKEALARRMLSRSSRNWPTSSNRLACSPGTPAMAT